MPEYPLDISLSSSNAVSIGSVSGVSGSVSGPFDADAIEIPDVLAGSFVATVSIPPISPDEIPGLVRWYDATQLVGYIDGDGVSQFPDLAGVAGGGIMDGGAGNPTRYPIYTINVQGGQPGLLIGGVNVRNFGQFPTPVSVQTVVAVAKLTGSAFPSNSIIGGGSAIVSTVSGAYPPQPRPYFPGTIAGTAFQTLAGVTQYLNGVANPTLEAVFGSSAVYECSLDTQIASENFLVGDANGYTVDGYIMEICAYSGQLTPTQRTALMGYFTDKYGL